MFKRQVSFHFPKSFLVIRLLPVVLVGWSLIGCGNTPTAVTSIPEAIPPSRVRVPACGPAEGKIMIGFEVQIPHNISDIIGFMPLLPTELPKPLTWSMVVLTGKSWTGRPAPFFHAAYGIWFAEPYTTYGLQTVVALDESEIALDPGMALSIASGNLIVTGHTPVVIMGTGSEATLYTLQSTPAQGSKPTTIAVLEWRQDGVFLRLSAVESGMYTLFPGGGGYMDRVVAWTGSSGALLQHLASSIELYTDCKQVG